MNPLVEDCAMTRDLVMDPFWPFLGQRGLLGVFIGAHALMRISFQRLHVSHGGNLDQFCW